MCQKKSYINIIAIIISIILAIVVSSIFSVAIFTNIPGILFTVLGISAFFLVTLIVTFFIVGKKEQDCICNYGPLLLLGSLGAIITSGLTALITVSVAVSAVIFGIVTFFFALAVIEFFLYVLCLIKNGCKCNECC